MVAEGKLRGHEKTGMMARKTESVLAAVIAKVFLTF